MLTIPKVMLPLQIARATFAVVSRNPQRKIRAGYI
jgi:hypothetical protein